MDECREIEFKIYNQNNEEVGKIMKFNQGFKKDTYNEEHIIIKFPENCTLKDKELILIASLYSNLTFFYESDHSVELDEMEGDKHK